MAQTLSGSALSDLSRQTEPEKTREGTGKVREWRREEGKEEVEEVGRREEGKEEVEEVGRREGGREEGKEGGGG